MAKNTNNPYKMGSTRKALFTGIMSMVLCIALLLGTTMAWFTSSTADRGNRIQAGKLAVALAKYNGTEYQNLHINDGRNGDIFSADTRWEPGRTEVVLLQVKNIGDLALNYNIIFEVAADTANGANLEEVLTYAIVPGMDAKKYSESGIQSWEGIRTAGTDVELGTMALGETSAAYLGEITEAQGEDYFALAVHMSEDAGNKYQGCALDIGVKIAAKQMAHESDSFGNQYDADALWTESLNVNSEISKWNAKLAAEDAVGHYQPLSDFRYPLTEGENLVTCGDFTEGDLDSWIPFNAANENGASLVEGYPGGEGQAMRLVRTGANSNGAILWQTTVELTEEDWGDEYQLSWYYKTNGVNCRNFVSVYFWDESHAADATKGWLSPDAILGPQWAQIADDQWHQAYGTFTIPEGTKYVDIIPRVASARNGAHYDFDEFTMYKTCEGGTSELPYGSDGRFTLETGGTIFYRDMESTEVSVKIENLAGNAAYANGYVDFELYDVGCTWAASGKKFDSTGVASATMNLAELLDTNKPYCLKATIYDGNGVKVQQITKELFMFERPEYLSEDGKFIKFGEDFNPVVGYHLYTNEDIIKAAAEGGVNVIQLGYRTSAEAVLEQLDNCAKLGVKGIVCLYYNMSPAGHTNNLGYTIDIVSDSRIRDHEALFGYCTMDEPFLNIANPLEARDLMINSYRLIRQYDQKNLVFYMEDNYERYNESAELTDVLFVDIYDFAEGAPIYTTAEKAKAAVGNDKSIWTLLMAFDYSYRYEGRVIDSDGLRNNNWQALLAGSDMVGYYSISDAGKTPDPASMPDGLTAMWEMSFGDDLEAGAKLWAGVCEFNDKEKGIAYDHFVREEGTTLSKDVNIEGGYISYSWADKDGKVYVILLNVKGEDVTVNVALENADSSAMGDFTANVIAGRSEGDTLTYHGNGTLSVDLTGVEAVLFEVQ